MIAAATAQSREWPLGGRVFVFIAAPGGVDRDAIATMAGVLGGARGDPAFWRDPAGRSAVGTATPGLLPEDRFDSQPFTSGPHVFACQARVDDRDDLLRALGIGGEEGARLADSELLHRAYLRWGADCGARFAGAFAFVAWNRDSGHVEAATDAIGATRLYYAAQGQTLILSTQLAALLAHPLVPRELDLDALGLLPAPKVIHGATPYRAIRTLANGHALRWDGRALRTERWWRPNTRPDLRFADPRDYALAASEMLERAVTACLRSTSPVATTLSGGLDSSIITAIAARRLGESGQRLAAYTSVPEPGLDPATQPGWDADDFPFAATISAAYPNIDHFAVAPGDRCPLDLLPAIHARSRTPIRNTANLLWLDAIAGRMAVAGERVLLMGERGNNGASIANDWAEDRSFPARLRRIAGDARARLRGPGGEAAVMRRRPGMPLLHRDFRNSRAALLGRFITQRRRRGHVAFMLSPANHWSPAPLAQWGIEHRDPHGDRRLIELLLRFPRESFTIDGLPRGLIRAMGRDLVPDAVRLRTRQGEQVPEIMALMARDRAKLEAALDRAVPVSAFTALFDAGEVRAMLDRVCSGQTHREHAAAVLRALDVGLFLATAGE